MATNDPSTQIRIASGSNALLGALLITLPWLLQYTSWEVGLTRNSIIVGALILICASFRIIRPRSSIAFSVANIAFGFWLLISSSLFGDTVATSGWLNLGVGTAVMVAAIWGANLIVGPEHGWRA